MFLLKLSRLFHKQKIHYGLVGGYAVSLHGAVRGTLDIDIVLPFNLEQYKKAEKALQSIGLQSRLPIIAEDVFNFREEYIKNKNLIAWSFVGEKNPSEIIDIIITHDLDQLSVIDMKIQGTKIKVVSIDDIIKMKKASGREQDLLDISALERIKKKKIKKN